MKDLRYLVCGGGGVGICAYAGAFEQLAQEPGFSFDRLEAVAGCSAGAIAALLISMNTPLEEMQTKLFSIDFSKMQDTKGWFAKLINLFFRFSMYKGQLLEDSLKEFIREKVVQCEIEMRKQHLLIAPEFETIFEKETHPQDITFADLKMLGCKDLHILTTQLFKRGDTYSSKMKVFSTQDTPNTSVVSAIKASAAAPVYVERVRLKKEAPGTYVESEDGHIYVDGGLSVNFPMKIFDKVDPNDLTRTIPNKHVLGLGLSGECGLEKMKKEVIEDGSVAEFIKSALHAIWTSRTSTENEKDPRAIMMYNNGIPLFKFAISDDEKSGLVESGRQAVEAYFAKQREEEIKKNTFPSNNRNYARLWNTSNERLIKDPEPEQQSVLRHRAVGKSG